MRTAFKFEVKKINKILNNEYFQIFLIIVAVKLVIYLISFVAFPLFQESNLHLSGTASEFFPRVWNRWDSLWYLKIAEFGYQIHGTDINSIAFFPLYPLLIRWFGFIVGDLKWAALLVSNLTSIAGLVMFYHLARFEFGKSVAYISTLSFLLFPTAYFFNAGYTEGLFLLLAASSFYAARKGKFSWAGLYAALATLTRLTGALLFPALLVELFLQWRKKETDWENGLWLLLIPGAFGLYLLLNYSVLGSFFGFLDVQRDYWFKSFAWPWHSIVGRFNSLGSYPYSIDVIMHSWIEFIAAIFLVVISVISFYKLRLSYSVFVALTAFISISTSFLLSVPRYILSAIPIFFIFGFWGQKKVVAIPLLVLSVSLLTMFAIQFTRGWWAF